MNANGEKIDNKILMVYYFNLGLDAKVGLEVERNRTKRRCCNYIMYALHGARAFFSYDYSDARHQIKRVVSEK